MGRQELRKTEATESQLVLILDDDVMVTEGLSAGLTREGRTIITCNDLESAELIVERLKPSHIVSDVRLSGQFGFEGLQFIRHARQYSPESRIILMTGDAPEALQMEASERGAVAFLQKPFEVRQLDSILDLLTSSALSSGDIDSPVMHMPMMDEIVASKALYPLFQPIVTLDKQPLPIGFEALARYRDNVLLRDPQVLFRYASRKGRVADLEVACVSQSLRTGAALARSGALFLNIHPDVLREGRKLYDVLQRDSEKYGISLHSVVLEITEQASLPDDKSAFDTFEQLRRIGVRFALDDVGVAYSHLPAIDRIQPSFLKISQHFGTSFEADPTKMKIVSNLLSLSSDFGCTLILEGIEHAETADVAANLGIRYGQGFLFARPAEADAFLRP